MYLANYSIAANLDGERDDLDLETSASPDGSLFRHFDVAVSRMRAMVERDVYNLGLSRVVAWVPGITQMSERVFHIEGTIPDGSEVLVIIRRIDFTE